MTRLSRHNYNNSVQASHLPTSVHYNARFSLSVDEGKSGKESDIKVTFLDNLNLETGNPAFCSITNNRDANPRKLID